MTDKEFWKIIDTSKHTSGYDFEKQKSVLKEFLLTNYSSHDIMLFKYFFDIYKINLYRWDLFNAYKLITKETDDDYFFSFREWLVAQGQEFYYNLLENPDEMLIQLPQEPILLLAKCTRDISSVALEVYIEITGDNSAHSFMHLNDFPNDDWANPEFDTKKELPLLLKKYSL